MRGPECGLAVLLPSGLCTGWWSLPSLPEDGRLQTRALEGSRAPGREDPWKDWGTGTGVFSGHVAALGDRVSDFFSAGHV